MDIGEFLEGVVGELEVGSGDIFFEVLDGGCAGDGEGEFGAAEQPCERDLEG